MSTHEKTQIGLFRAILEEGPLTLYAANSRSNSPIGTIHRHFKQMIESKWIKIYAHLEDKSRRKIPYGPTLLGLIHFYRLDKTIQSRLDYHFLRWIRFEDFTAELDDEGFELKNLKNSKELFRKYVYYFAGVEDQIETLRDPQTVPRELLLYIGEFLLVRRPEYMKIWEELYKKMPMIRKNVDGYMESTIEFYNTLKKRSKNLS